MNKVLTFINEVRSEITKIVWPKRDDLIGSSIIVCFLALVFAVILGFMDFGFSQVIKKLLN